MSTLRHLAASILASLMVVTVVTPAAHASDSALPVTPGQTVSSDAPDGASADLWVSDRRWADGQLSTGVDDVIPSPDRALTEPYRVNFVTRGGDTVTDVAPQMQDSTVVTAGLTVSIPVDVAPASRPVMVQWQGDGWTQLPTAYDADAGVAWTEAPSTGVFAVTAESRGGKGLPTVAIDLSNPDASALWDGSLVGEHDVTADIAEELAGYVESVCAADPVMVGVEGLAISAELRGDALALLEPDLVVSLDAGSDTGFMSGSESSGGPVLRANEAAAALADAAAEELPAHTGRTVTLSEETPGVQVGDVPTLSVSVGDLDHNYDRAVLERRPDLYALALAKSVTTALDEDAGVCGGSGSAVPAEDTAARGGSAPRMSSIDVSRLQELLRMGSWSDGEQTSSITYAGYTITGTFTVDDNYPDEGDSGAVTVTSTWSGTPPASHPFWSATVGQYSWLVRYLAVSLTSGGDGVVLRPRAVSSVDLSSSKVVTQGATESSVTFYVPDDWERNIYVGGNLVWTASGATPGTPGGGPPPVPPLPSEPTPELLELFRSFGISLEYLFGGDPVNLSTGTMAQTEETIALTGVGDQVIDLTLSYNGGDTRLSQLGRGWNFAYGSRAQLYSNGSVLVTMADGRGLFFESDGADGFTATPGARASLEAITGGVRLTQGDGTTMEFLIDGDTGAGVLSAMVDRQGNATTFEYGELVEGSEEEPTFAPLTSITDEAGQTVEVGSTAEGRITGLTHPDGREWLLEYDNHNLVTITDGADRERHFGYDSDDRLVTVTGADGVVEVYNTYDSEDRVSVQVDGVGSVRAFEYDGDGNTTVTDSLGEVSVIEHNDDGLPARH